MSIALIRRLADSEDPTSLANRLRTRRFKLFDQLSSSLPKPMQILDLGGTTAFWQCRGWANREDVLITTLNLQAEKQSFRNIVPCVGDATDLSQFANKSFDVVFSNSVIEHLFDFHQQTRMAQEVQRVGRCFWVQTPNYWFPMEPHFHVPGWQWMPFQVRVSLIQRWKCGWRGPCPDLADAQEAVKELRLLTKRELRRLFPDCNIVPERFCGLVKSWTVVGGFRNSEKLRGFYAE